MTREQKAKAYDEALKRARKHYNSKYHPSEGPSGVYLNNADLEEMFPELKESEDERIREAIEGALRVYGKTQGEWIGGYDMDTLVVHLREAFSALEKQKEQKPAEWSEEDEEMRSAILQDLANIKAAFPKVNIQEEFDWLKSLRPQSHWKPREKHLSALLAIFNDPNNIGSQTCQLALTDLYEQLKKLM